MAVDPAWVRAARQAARVSNGQTAPTDVASSQDPCPPPRGPESRVARENDRAGARRRTTAKAPMRTDDGTGDLLERRPDAWAGVRWGPSSDGGVRAPFGVHTCRSFMARIGPVHVQRCNFELDTKVT